ncbi:MAG: site-specific integrase [Sandaracinus sp.]
MTPQRCAVMVMVILLATPTAKAQGAPLRTVLGFRVDQTAEHAARACIDAGYRTGVAPGAVRCEGWADAEDAGWVRPYATDLQFCDGDLCHVHVRWETDVQQHLDPDHVGAAVAATLVDRYGEGRNGDGSPFDASVDGGRTRLWQAASEWFVILRRRGPSVTLTFFQRRQPGELPAAWAWTDPPSHTAAPTEVGGFALGWRPSRIARECRAAGLTFSEDEIGDETVYTCASDLEHFVLGPAHAVAFRTSAGDRVRQVEVHWRAEGMSVPIDEAAAALRTQLSSRFATRAWAENTRRAYRGAWCRFRAWCDAHGEQLLPASEAAVADYLADLAKSGRKLGTLNVALSAIAHAHRLAERSSPTSGPRSDGAQGHPEHHRRRRAPEGTDPHRETSARSLVRLR